MEQIREIITDFEVKNFKKSLFGYDKKEIMEYINTQEENSKKSIYNYEKKLAEQANSLTMALREKETLAAKVEEIEKKVKLLSIDVDEQKSSIVAENNALKSQIEELSEYKNKNEVLSTEMVGLKTRCEYVESERQGFLETIAEKEATILTQCKNNAESERLLKTEMDKIKTQYDSIRKVQLLNIQSAKESLTKVINIVEQM